MPSVDRQTGLFTGEQGFTGRQALPSRLSILLDLSCGEGSLAPSPASTQPGKTAGLAVGLPGGSLGLSCAPGTAQAV